MLNSHVKAVVRVELLFFSVSGRLFLLLPFLTCFFLPCFIGVLCFSELFFIKEPHDVTVMRKEAVILDCQAHGESPIDVRWLKNGVKIVENERVYLLANGSLFISEVESRRGDKSDEGLYQCLAQNKYGAILSQKARLTIASEYHAGVGERIIVKNIRCDEM